MVSYQQIASMLSGCTAMQKALFTCACAERAHAVLVAVAAPASVQFSRAALDKAWRSVNSPASLRSTHDELTVLPEAAIEDSNDPKYYAMRALGLIADALRAVDRDPDDVATSTAGGALDLASDLAHATGEATLPELEGAAQMRTLTLLLAGHTSRTAEELRRVGVQAADALARAATTVSHTSGGT